MQQHCSCGFRNVPDRSFGYAILEVGIDPAVSYCLMLLAAVLLEFIVGKSAIVCVVLFNSHAVVCRESLECLFCFNGFF
jgi:hypothetical protein